MIGSIHLYFNVMDIIKMKKHFIITLLIHLFLVSTFSFAASEKLQAPLFDNIGSFHRKISTNTPLAQHFFDQGLIFFYGFEWGESIRSFQEATRLDPSCGICYWGLAMAISHKINAPLTGNEYLDAKNAIDTAISLAPYASPREKDYINTLALRFKYEPKIESPMGPLRCHNTSRNTFSQKATLEYLKGMKKLAEKYPLDLSANVLYAAELFWNPIEDVAIRDATVTLKNVLEINKKHLGANHYFIHVIEPTSHPEEALESANLLRTLVPDSEHLVHMPSHIYFLTGRYHEATEANQNAIKTFENYIDTCRAQGFEPEINYLYLHNYDFLRTTASMEGRKELAVSAAKKLVSSPFSSWLANEPSLQWFIPVPYYVEARFGLWRNILKEPMPKANYQYATGMWHYARGMAFTHLKKIKDAELELFSLQNIMHKGSIPENLEKSGYNQLTLASEILSAALANAHHNEKLTISHLQTASKIQQEIGYREPPDWYFPVKQVLGDAYFKWGYSKDAVRVYKEDLKEYPLNGWSLFGLAKALRKLKRDEEAEHVEIVFRESWKYADVTPPSQI